MFIISSPDAGWNNEIVGGGLSGIINEFKSTQGSFERRALIYPQKRTKLISRKSGWKI